ncbi:MAG: ABC transporter ATP-binding protein [Planctomycetes bacterium]|nr:ABC transporter ATP-binding protein [Planctomycetota bacterium]MCC7173064.1 ABC transporter ATP-binding protein [Planctomycetota bacterium]
METLLQVSDLLVRYGDRVAVGAISFDIGRGEILGLLGPNGAGKTSTISCISGLREPDGGRFAFDGAAFSPNSDANARARIGLVPQSLALYDELSADENLLFFARIAGLGRADARIAADRGLELSGLTDRRRDRVSTFSGGMKRRLNLAAGDLHQPALLVLDEPTVGVDPQSRQHIFDALERLKAEGRSLLYTTHYMEEAERLCDRIAIMDEGRILDVGPATALAERAGLPGANLETVFLKLTGKQLRDA